jgi:WD40 repeat protein/DNA-binding SARP family transcriptional activator
VAISVLGPLNVDGDSSSLGPRDRVVLEVLALRAGDVVSAERLADAMWGDVPPPTWNKVVQGCVSRLRKVLGIAAIETSPAGYRLMTPPDEIDSHRFERMVRRSAELLALGEHDRAAYVSGEALALWRGPALRELEDWEAGRIEAARLDALRWDAEEIRVDAALRAGRHREVLSEAQTRVSEAPLRERRWALLALAQYQAGRQADALRTLHQARTVLVAELGIEPGPDLVALEQAILRQDPSLVVAAALPEPAAVCPYLGLVPYDVADADGFFGRDAEVEACLARLAAVGVLAVVGPSGSGKSSLVRAGVAASLQRNGRRVVVITPGPRPMDALTALPESGPVPVLVVDQCEEAVTLCDDAAERTAFFDALVLHAQRGPLAIALRADRLGDMSAAAGFARLVEPGLHLVSAMSEVDLRAAIEGPARQIGLLLEPGLVDLLVREVEGEPGALPLLSHALHQTWRRREGRTLTVDGYQQTGGIRGSVAQSAEEVYDQVPHDQQPVLRDLLLRLVTPTPEGEPVRSRVPRRTVATDPEHERLIELLVRARLVTSDDQTVELAHEALARAWPRLRNWLDDDVDGQRILRHLALAADTWDSMDRPHSELYRGVRLAQALDWQESANPDLTPVERAFLDKSAEQDRTEAAATEQRLRQQARQNRRLRLLLGGVAVLLVVAMVAGILAVRQAHRADTAGTLAEARRLGTQALVVDGYDKALLLAVEGRHLDDSLETRANLFATIERSPDVANVIRSDTGIVDLALTPDGKTLLVTGGKGSSGALSAIDVGTGASRGTLALTGLMSQAALSPDGRLAVATDSPGDPNVKLDRLVHIVDPTTLAIVGVPLNVSTPSCVKRTEGCAALNLSFSPDDKLVAAVTGIDLGGSTTPPGEALVWDVAKGGSPIETYEFNAASRQRDVVFLPDSKTMLVAGGDGTAVVDIASGRESRVIEGAYAPIGLSPDGRTLAATLDPKTAVTIGLFDVVSGQRGATLGGHSERIDRLVFSHDGTMLASAGDDRLAMVWDVKTGEREDVFSGQTATVEGLAFSPDQRRLYSSSLDGSIYVWDLTRSTAVVHAVPAGQRSSALDFPVGFMQISPDGAYVAFSSLDDYRFQFKAVATGAVSAPSKVPLDGFAGFSPDSKRYITDDPNRAIRVWDRASRTLVAQGSATADNNGQYYTPDGARVVSMEGDSPLSSSSLRVLDANTLEPVDGASLTIAPGPRNVVVTPDGQQAVLFTAKSLETPGSKVVVVDLGSRRVARSLQVDGINTPRASALAADGRTTVLGGSDGNVEVVNATSGAMTPAFKAHDGPLESLSFAPDGATFVSAGWDGAVRLWDTGTQQLLGAVQPLGANRVVTAKFIGPTTVLIADTTGQLFEWDTRPDDWEAHACAVAGRNFTKAEWAELFPGQSYRSTCPQYPPGT